MIRLVKFNKLKDKDLDKIIDKHYTHWKQYNNKLDLNELLQTISAKSLLEWAGEYLIGFISYNFTFIPLLAIWYAASHPANPPPIIVI